MEELRKISEEEKRYLQGQGQVEKSIYTEKEKFEIDSEKFLKENRFVTVRRHSRFVEFPEHKHNYVEMMYVCSGSITHIIDGKEIVMEEGDFLLLNKESSHGVRRAEREDIGINFIALPEFFDIPMQMLNEKNILAEFIGDVFRSRHSVAHYLLFRVGENFEIQHLLENMLHSLLYDEKTPDVLLQYTMGLVFLYLLQDMDALRENSSKDYKEILVQAALKYIDTSFRTAELSQIAKDFHRSVSSVSRIIKNETGYTFKELLMRKRFQKAVMYIVETDLPIEEIIYQVGYENDSYFYRQFRERYGMTPRKYREAYVGKGDIRL